MQWLLDAVEQYAGHGKTMAKTGHGGAQNLSSDSSLSTGLTHLRTLLERFANGKSMKPILDAIRTLGEDAKQDEGLRNWLHEVDEYTRRVLMEPGYILQPDSDKRAEELKEKGRVYWDGKYKGHFDGVFDETGVFFGSMGEVGIFRSFEIHDSELFLLSSGCSRAFLPYAPFLLDSRTRIHLLTLP
jgi:hypothetical protein